MRKTAILAFLLGPVVSWGLIVARADAQQSPGTQTETRPGHEAKPLVVAVHDENGLPVVAANLMLERPGAAWPLRTATDYAGRATFPEVSSDVWKLTVEKEGFYAVTMPEIHGGQTETIEVTLNHFQEYKETVKVSASPEAIDPTATPMTAGLTAQEVLELPYPTTRDVRNALQLIPGVTPDLNGQVHVQGSPSNQVLYTLDGFDITQPFTGLNELRVSTDAVRGIDVDSSRNSAEFGRGSAGILNLSTGMGDDHLRFYATDFVPNIQQVHGGLHFQNVTPRFTFSGPIEKGKAWFYEAVEGEYDQNIFGELPPGQDSDNFWRVSNLLRGQVNLTPGNRLISSFVINHSYEDHAGLSIIQPFSTTTENTNTAYLATLKDQATWSNGTLFEIGFGFNQYRNDMVPLGNLPYVMTPGSASGNFYLDSKALARRYEGLAKLNLPPLDWLGHHQLLIGGDLQSIHGDTLQSRQPFTILRADSTLARAVSFMSPPEFRKNDFELAGYVQDRWSPTDRLLIEAGLRLSGDEILRRVLTSPRLATTFLLSRSGDTKLSGGIGLDYDRTDLALLARPLAGSRQDIFYAADGITPLGPPVITQFQASPGILATPRLLNWSIGIERKLPDAVYLKVDFIEKRGMHQYDYLNQPAPVGSTLPSGLFVLGDTRRDKFDGVIISVRHTFRESYPVMISYERSDARSNAVLDSTLDNPLFSPQLGGPLAWDSPNRVVSWGWVPVKVPIIHKSNLSYTFSWRSGYPYSLINAEQELVGFPNTIRFPDYASLDLHLEKEFHMFGFQWAIRGGFNDITGRKNPLVVNNNIDSPMFGQFGGLQHRTFTGRIRFLGRK